MYPEVWPFSIDTVGLPEGKSHQNPIKMPFNHHFPMGLMGFLWFPMVSPWFPLGSLLRRRPSPRRFTNQLADTDGESGASGAAAERPWRRDMGTLQFQWEMVIGEWSIRWFPQI